MNFLATYSMYIRKHVCMYVCRDVQQAMRHRNMYRALLQLMMMHHVHIYIATARGCPTKRRRRPSFSTEEPRAWTMDQCTPICSQHLPSVWNHRNGTQCSKWQQQLLQKMNKKQLGTGYLHVCTYVRTHIPTSCSVLLSHLLAQWRVEVRQAVDWTVGDVVLLPATPPQWGIWSLQRHMDMMYNVTCSMDTHTHVHSHAHASNTARKHKWSQLTDVSLLNWYSRFFLIKFS